MRDQLIKALLAHAAGEIEIHKANVEVYFANPAGIGEHSDIMEAVQGELDKIALHEERLAILRNWPQEKENEQETS